DHNETDEALQSLHVLESLAVEDFVELMTDLCLGNFRHTLAGTAGGHAHIIIQTAFGCMWLGTVARTRRSLPRFFHGKLILGRAFHGRPKTRPADHEIISLVIREFELPIFASERQLECQLHDTLLTCRAADVSSCQRPRSRSVGIGGTDVSAEDRCPRVANFEMVECVKCFGTEIQLESLGNWESPPDRCIEVPVAGAWQRIAAERSIASQRSHHKRT